MKLNFTYFITYFGIICVTVVLSSSGSGGYQEQPRRRPLEGSGAGSGGPGADDEDMRPRGRLPHLRTTARASPQPTPWRRKPLLKEDWRRGGPRRSPSDNRLNPRDEGSGDAVDNEADRTTAPQGHLEIQPQPKLPPTRGSFATRPAPVTRRSCREAQSLKGLPYDPKCTTDGQFEALQCTDFDCFCVDTRVGTIIEKTRTVPKDPIDCKWMRYLIQIPLLRDHRNRIADRRQFREKLMKQINGSSTPLLGGHEIIKFIRFLPTSPQVSPHGVELELRTIGHRVRVNLRQKMTDFLRKMRDNDMPIGRLHLLNITALTGSLLPERRDSEVRRPGGGLLQDDVDKERRSRFAGDETVDGRQEGKANYNIRDQSVGTGKEVQDDPNSGKESARSKKQRDGNKKVSATLFEQPGIIAAIIGGGIAGFFLTILLILFCIYRIRKKDEGSYALEEPKKTPVSAAVYHSAPTREYYA